MDPTWVEEVFLEAGLEPEVAGPAAHLTVARLLAPRRPRSERGRVRIIDALVKDPTHSVARILGEGDLGLPFHDPGTGRLSAAALAGVFAEVGEDPVVAMAFARVVVEACDPGEFYRPLWEGLGRTDELDLAALARLDFAPLRAAQGR